MTYPHVDQSLWDAAMEPKEIVYSNDVFGEVAFDLYFCVLRKGVGKQVYDPQQHAAGERRTCVTINITDLSGVNYRREFVAEIPGDGWQKVTLPSLKALGVNAPALEGAYVHAVMEPFGEYTDKNGEKKMRIAPAIKRIFKTREECEAAAQGAAQQVSIFDGAAPGTNGSTPNTGNSGNDAERAVALAFLPALVKATVRGNGIDHAALEKALADNPIMARYFTLASPEVAQAMEQALSEPAF